MRHVNIPIFIPHLGCPNQCVFCNQHTISGVESFDPSSVKNIIDDALSTIADDDVAEIAFFGGSFTGIDRDLMIELLSTASSYIKQGRIESIRCSTRPDYINTEVLEILKKYGVKHIELGLQSASDGVLALSKRGHSRADEARACSLIKEHGFTLTGQMMIGLPGSTLQHELDTADFIIEQKCDYARIYPTVVFRNTELCCMAESGVYTPITLEDAISRSAAVYRKLTDAGVRVIRVGLCAAENLVSEDTYYAGPNHSALGELVQNEIYYNVIYEKAKALEPSVGAVLYVRVPEHSLSKAIGQRKRNKLLLKERLGLSDVVFIGDRELGGSDISVSVKEGEN